MSNLYLGVMSGTSLDGVDIALCEIDADSCTLLHAQEYPFPKSLKEEILRSIESAITLKELGTLDQKLAQLFSRSIHEFLEEFTIRPQDIRAVGLHGQTLWHEPSGTFPFSMQLGDANRVAAETAITTITDFRRMDMANDGEGAPFAPAFHHFLFHNLAQSVAIINIGGMANITLFEKNLRGFDIGCGNVLLDIWVQESQEKSYDKDGAFAKSGSLHQELLDAMLADSYFQKSPPKSTGREYFNAQWLHSYLKRFAKLPEADVQRTLLELVAQSITKELESAGVKIAIICGGGAKNAFLMQRFQALSHSEIKSSDSLGVSSDFMEAMAFAWFAYKRVHNEKVDLRGVTGAKKRSLLGAIYG